MAFASSGTALTDAGTTLDSALTADVAAANELSRTVALLHVVLMHRAKCLSSPAYRLWVDGL